MSGMLPFVLLVISVGCAEEHLPGIITNREFIMSIPSEVPITMAMETKGYQEILKFSFAESQKPYETKSRNFPKDKLPEDQSFYLTMEKIFEGNNCKIVFFINGREEWNITFEDMKPDRVTVDSYDGGIIFHELDNIIEQKLTLEWFENPSIFITPGKNAKGEIVIMFSSSKDTNTEQCSVSLDDIPKGEQLSMAFVVDSKKDRRRGLVIVEGEGFCKELCYINVSDAMDQVVVHTYQEIQIGSEFSNRLGAIGCDYGGSAWIIFVVFVGIVGVVGVVGIGIRCWFKHRPMAERKMTLNGIEITIASFRGNGNHNGGEANETGSSAAIDVETNQDISLDNGRCPPQLPENGNGVVLGNNHQNAHI